MSEAEAHVFTRRHASPALVKAMDQLAARIGCDPESMEQMTLGEAFGLARKSYGSELPEFWVIWNDWNSAPETPQPMGDL